MLLFSVCLLLVIVVVVSETVPDYYDWKALEKSRSYICSDLQCEAAMYFAQWHIFVCFVNLHRPEANA